MQTHSRNLRYSIMHHIIMEGDNNLLDDTSIYSPGRSRMMRDEIIGLVRVYIPYLNDE
jgi:hypothetical protein